MSLNIQENVKLSQYTTYKLGGPARYFVDAKNEDEIIEAFAWARQKKVPYFILGGGSNILVSDKGFNGLVVRIQNTKYEIKNNRIEAGAGMDLSDLVETSINSGFQGLEWASGIPGTFGGAVRGNAGAFGGELKDIITAVKFLDKKGNIRRATNKECKFSYRTSIFKESAGKVIISASIDLKEGDLEALKETSKNIIDFRASRHPLEYGSCGSVFKAVELNAIHPSHFEKYPAFAKMVKNDPSPVVPMACFIDEASLKGYRIGGAMISNKHPNFFVNYDNASAEDVVTLISFAKYRLRDAFKIQAEEEVQYVGF